jgi:KipI family sensor histidine kinase inhibitor
VRTGLPVRLECREYGDAAVLVDVLGENYEERWSVTQSIGRSLRRDSPPGVLDLVASYQNIVVLFDPLVTDADAIAAAVRRFAHQPRPLRAGKVHEISVVYGGDHGPDLDAVAAELGLESRDVVDLHASTEWMVRFIGSPAGAPMLDGWSVPAGVSRLSQPRGRVEPGSVGVSGPQSTIYNAPSPGGWRLIGRTPQLLFDMDRVPPVSYRPGDRIRFIPVEGWHGN